MSLLESGEEGSAVNAIEDRGGPVQDFRQIQFLKLAGVGNFMEELAKNRNAEVVRGEAPVE